MKLMTLNSKYYISINLLRVLVVFTYNLDFNQYNRHPNIEYIDH